MNSQIQQINPETGRVTFDDYKNPAERTSITIIHEAGHPIFRDHSKRQGRHVPGTIMATLPARDSTYDEKMLERLRDLYGTPHPNN